MCIKVSLSIAVPSPARIVLEEELSYNLGTKAHLSVAPDGAVT